MPIVVAPGTSSEDPPLPLWRPPEGALHGRASFGMTTRRGGRSLEPFAAFNVSLGVGDDETAVRWNRARLRGALGYEGDIPHLLHQVHGARIVRPEEAPVDADGFEIRRGDPWVAVSAADCAPVAVIAKDGERGALLHSGWRGAHAGIAAEAVRRLTGDDDASGLQAAIGPCIHACCFPVGPDVAALFDAALHRPHPSGKTAIDLPGAIEASLIRAGVRRERIHVAPECTSCERDAFYSYRRDQGVTGRHWAFLRIA